MLLFIVPLKSQVVSKSWQQTCQLFERCLRSICSQTDVNFRVVVVCHEKPDIKFTHPHVHYVEVDFAPPEPNTANKNPDIANKYRDRSKKVIDGLIYACQFSANHVMFVDADDCLSCDIAKFTNQYPDANGWFLNKGYVYQEKSPFIYYRKSHFHKWCGTCNIIRFNLCPLPEKDQEDYPEDLLLLYDGANHKNIENIMIEQGNPLQELPFVGAIYTIGNGENIYQSGFSTIHNANQGNLLFFAKELLKFRPLTRSIRKEFNLYEMTSIA